MALELIIDGQEAVMKKDVSFDYVSENRAFTDADDYSMNIDLPLAGCKKNIDIFGQLTRKDVENEDIFFDAILQCDNFRKKGAIVITGITQEAVKVQFLEKRSYQNFFPTFDETYINELELGSWPEYTPEGINTSGSGGQPSIYSGWTQKTPQELWQRTDDYTALPWVDFSDSKIQNIAKWNSTANRMKWKVEPDDSDDEQYSEVLSFQPNLLWITKKICDEMGYIYDFTAWQNSDYKYLFIMNTLPGAAGDRQWASALPHWTVNEFFKELEKLLLCEFDIDHARKIVTCSMSSANESNAGQVRIDKVVDEFSVDVSTENKTGYKAMRNQCFAEAGHRMEQFYDCQWYIDKMTKPDGTVICTSYNTLADLISSSLKQNAVFDTSGGRYSGKWGLHYAADVDTYFVLEVVKRVKYRTGQLDNAMNWGNVCRLVPVNRFGPNLVDTENKNDKDEIKIVPAWIDELEDYSELLVFLECSMSEDGVTSDRQTHIGRAPGIEKVDPDVILQFGAYSRLEKGETDKSDSVFDELFVAYWDGNYSLFGHNMPHPWVDKFDLSVSYSLSQPDTTAGTITITWTSLTNSHDFSLRINNSAYGQGLERTSYKEIDKNKAYNFSFIADDIPNVRSVFFIEGQRYLCEKITATFTNEGLSKLMKGVFYKMM